MIEAQLERLAQAGFQRLPTPQILTHYVIERDGFVALVERRADGAFGGIGTPGLLADGTFSVLVWKQGAPLFVSKGREAPATSEQLDSLRKFEADLRAALG
ncbi:MAG: hypothetical protein HY236_15830 [Acidobacteria bacterium]|nr:hypothetical protein [Acidobacteriota bacterium]